MLSWSFSFSEDKDSHLTDIFFMPAMLECLLLRARLLRVLFIDCTCNRIKAKLPFKRVVGCTNKNTMSMGQAYEYRIGYASTGERE